MPVFWLVMRSNGQRPKVRHASLADAQAEATRIAANNPAGEVWVIRCETTETHRAAAGNVQADGSAAAAPSVPGGQVDAA